MQTGCMKVYTFSCNADSIGMIHISMVVLQKCTDILKDEPGLCSETCLTAHDGNQAIDVKFQKGSDIEEEDDPVAITFPALKAEQEVSCVSMCPWLDTFCLCVTAFARLSPCLPST
jgi:hypothetical protein